MRFSASGTTVFQPVTIEIHVETQADLDLLRAMSNNSVAMAKALASPRQVAAEFLLRQLPSLAEGVRR